MVKNYEYGCHDVVETHDPAADYPWQVTAVVRSTDQTILDGVSGRTASGRGKTRSAAWLAALNADADMIPAPSDGV